MAAERWIKVTREQRDKAVSEVACGKWITVIASTIVARQITDAFDAAEGQRVETIRWCTAHDTAIDACVIEEAALLLPPEAV